MRQPWEKLGLLLIPTSGHTDLDSLSGPTHLNSWLDIHLQWRNLEGFFSGIDFFYVQDVS